MAHRKYQIEIQKGLMNMTREAKLAILEGRLAKLEGSHKNIKSAGVVTKLRRQVRNLKNSIC